MAFLHFTTLGTPRVPMVELPTLPPLHPWLEATIPATCRREIEALPLQVTHENLGRYIALVFQLPEIIPVQDDELPIVSR